MKKICILLFLIFCSNKTFAEGPIYNFNFYNPGDGDKDQQNPPSMVLPTNSKTTNSAVTPPTATNPQDAQIAQLIEQNKVLTEQLVKKNKTHMERLMENVNLGGNLNRGFGITLLSGFIESEDYSNQNPDVGSSQINVTNSTIALSSSISDTFRALFGINYFNACLHDSTVGDYDFKKKGLYLGVAKDFEISTHFRITSRLSWASSIDTNDGINYTLADDSPRYFYDLEVFQVSLSPSWHWKHFAIGIDFNMANTRLKSQNENTGSLPSIIDDNYFSDDRPHNNKYKFTTYGGGLHISFFI